MIYILCMYVCMSVYMIINIVLIESIQSLCSWPFCLCIYSYSLTNIQNATNTRMFTKNCRGNVVKTPIAKRLDHRSIENCIGPHVRRKREDDWSPCIKE